MSVATNTGEVNLNADATSAPQVLRAAHPSSPARDGEARGTAAGQGSKEDTTTVTPLLPAGQRGRKRRERPAQFRAAGRWVGHVMQVMDHTFVARLVDQMAPSPPEVAEFDLEDVPPAERTLVVEGARVYWAVGHRIRSDGTYERALPLHVRRAPLLTQAQLDEADEWATSIGRQLGLND